MYVNVHKSYNERVNYDWNTRIGSYSGFGVVVIAASAGGIEALLSLLAVLPEDFRAPIIVIQHLPPASRYSSKLKEILQRRTLLRVKWAEDQESLLPGTIYIGPQDRKTVLSTLTGRLLVSEGENEELARPTADPLFRSAAQFFGNRSLAVVLSGVLADGADGSGEIACAGGRVLPQIATEALYSDMPRAAMQRSRVGLAFDTVTLARIIVNLVMAPGAAEWFGIGRAGVCSQFLTA